MTFLMTFHYFTCLLTQIFKTNIFGAGFVESSGERGNAFPLSLNSHCLYAYYFHYDFLSKVLEGSLKLKNYPFIT